MKLKNPKNKQFIEKYNITQPTDLLAKNEYVVLNKNISRLFGLSFSAFVSALFTKYQSLTKSKAFTKNNREEFWYTEKDSKDDIGISYYMRKKAIKTGIELGIWECEAKYNPMFPGIINKTDHFIINWDKVVEFFIMIENPNLDTDVDAEETAETIAIQDEINNLEKQIEQFENKEIKTIITTQEIEEFANEMSSQNGIRSSQSYKLSILTKAFSNDKDTLTKIQLWLKDRQTKSETNNNKDFDFLKNYFVYYENIKFYIKAVSQEDGKIHFKAQDAADKQITFSTHFENFEEFRSSFIYDGFVNARYKNFDTGENVNG